jgi:hypothetical protein
MIVLLSLNAASAYSAEANGSDGSMLSHSQESITVSHQAADELNQPQVATSNPAQAPLTTADASANTSSSKGSSLKSSPAKKFTSIVTAFAIGTPVCMVRRTKYEESYAVKHWVGNSKSKFTRILAGTFWLPGAIVCGCGEAPFDAFANALMYPAFSKDQISEGKLIQNN